MNIPTPSCDAEGTELVPIEFARALERRAICAENKLNKLIHLADLSYSIVIDDIDTSFLDDPPHVQLETKLREKRKEILESAKYSRNQQSTSYQCSPIYDHSKDRQINRPHADIEEDKLPLAFLGKMLLSRPSVEVTVD